MAAEANTRRLVIAGAVVLIAAAAFWLLLLSPKKEKAAELASTVEAQQVTLTEAQTKVAEGEVARKAFPKDYRKMVILGKAVPEGDETASLILQIGVLTDRKHVELESLTLEGGGESTETASTAQEAGPTSAPIPVPPTEAEASLLPLGATVGQADLGVMPYKLNLRGTYSHLTEVLHGVQRLIKTHNDRLKIDGRLLTMSGFSLSPADEETSRILTAEIAIAAYVAPPSSAPTEIGAGEVELAPEGEAVAPAVGETTTASPSSYPTGEDVQ